MSFDSIADLFCSLNNANLVGKRIINTPFSYYKKTILDLLVDECIIEKYDIVPTRTFNSFVITLFEVKTFNKITRISKSSLRVYRKKKDITTKKGFYIVSNSKHGIINSDTAKFLGVGGEIIGLVI